MNLSNLYIDNTPFSRRIVQVVADLARRPLTGLRVLDLACAHGAYAFEMANLGAHVLGIEGRESWLDYARRAKEEGGWSNVEFVQDDVRNLSKTKYGEFDIVLCLGILYHLDAPDVFDFVAQLADVCREFAVIETHFAGEPRKAHEWRGKPYWGMSTLEHAAGVTPKEKLQALGASLDNEQAFWFTQPSLCNILRHVGFTSVYDCRNPVANLYVGPERLFKIWGNRITLAAIKGQSVRMLCDPAMTTSSEADWPEDLEAHLFERGLREYQALEAQEAEQPAPPPAPDTPAASVRQLVRRFLPW